MIKSDAEKLSSPQILSWLHSVEDPELGVSLVELGLIYEVNMDGDTLRVEMTLTSPACPAGDYIVGMITQRAKEHPLIKEVKVEMVWDPPWDPREMASEEAKDALGIW